MYGLNLTALNGDCLELMASIPDNSIDAIITDPPYGTTACKWDSIIPLEPMWKEVNRIIKPNGAIILFGQEPFATVLRYSNLKNYKYDWIWDKVKPGAFAIAKYTPLKQHELIIVFTSNGAKLNYYPQMTKLEKTRKSKIYSSSDSASVKYNDGLEREYKEKYPKTIIQISNANQSNKIHPTQKPVSLIEYLIKTYTQENETVLDFTAGSFTTGIACINTNRNFIGIELNEDYYRMGLNRMRDHIEVMGCKIELVTKL